MKRYNLVNTRTRMIMPEIIISEIAKEDFKEMMGWDEQTWRYNTSELEIKEKVQKRKTMDIWRNINLLLGLNWDIYGENIRGIYNQKELLKLEKAINELKPKHEK